MFLELLKKYRKNKKLTQTDLANKLSDLLGYEVKTTNVQSWERGVNPKLEMIISIAEILDIPEQYLFNDSDDIINQMVGNRMPSIKKMTDNTSQVQLYDGLCGAGSGGILYNTTDNFIFIDKQLIKKKYQDRPVVGLKIVGDSMKPYIDTGDILLVNMINEFDDKPTIDGKYVINTIQGTQLKNLSFRSNGDIVISSTNKEYPDEIINIIESQEQLDIIGVPVGRLLMS
jgi:transcriptional regulator with XRE-family HTH domain